MCSCKRHGDRFATCTCSCPHPAPTTPTPDDAALAERTPPLPTRDEVGDVLADAGIVRQGHVFERVVEADLTYLTRALAPLFADFDREVRDDERARLAARRDKVAEALVPVVYAQHVITYVGDDDFLHVKPWSWLTESYQEHIRAEAREYVGEVLAALGVDRG